MQVDRYVIHDIELVVDRMPVTTDMRLRLSQSVQMALKLGKDLMQIFNHDTHALVQYSKALMCEETGLSYDEPSPNTFSFNSPYGACPTCKGLGSVYTINIAEVVPDKSKSVKEGGIAPLGEERDASVYQQVVAFAKKHKINLGVPLSQLQPEQLDLLLYGEELVNKSLDLNLEDDSIPETYTGSYEGIINMLKRWFISTNSNDGLKDWVEKFMTLQTCPSCNGTRLKKESLWFKVAERNIAELSAMNLDKLMLWFDGIETRMNKKQQVIGKDVLKEIRERLQFLLDVGLTYLSMGRPSKPLVVAKASEFDWLRK